MLAFGGRRRVGVRIVVRIVVRAVVVASLLGLDTLGAARWR